MKCRGVEDGCIDRRTAMAGLVATAGWAWAGPAAAETGVTDTRIKVVEINPHVIALRDEFQVPADDERFKVRRGD
eukprot:gene2483-3228_t